VARGSRLFVGDALCSVSVIDLVETEGGDSRLKSVAKDFSPLWPVTVESLDRDTIIGANVSRPLQQLKVSFTDLSASQMDCNLFTYSVQQEENKMVLERDGFWNLGEVVNKFIAGTRTPSPWLCRHFLFVHL
jgi:DNA damage-binding protein 1